MIHIFDSTTQPDNRVMRGMFEARKSVFVDLLKWDVPLLDGRFELDQFDDDHAVYIILTDSSGNHLASARLLPTIRPHILDTLFQFLCEDAAPRGPGIWEITRFCLDRNLRAADRRSVRNLLVTAIAEHALAQDIHAYTGVAELGWYQQIMAFGWRCLPLGFPKPYRGATLAALTIEIDQDTPRQLTLAGVYSMPSIEDFPMKRSREIGL